MLAAVLVALLGARTGEASSGGIASTSFGANGCNQCHASAVNPPTVNTPTVVLTASDTTLSAGQQITLTLSVTTDNGDPGAAGFNVRSSQQGTFAVGGPSSAGTRTITGASSWLEATHSARKLGEPAVFTTLWTPSVGTTGAVTFTGWGNAVNGAAGYAGDHAASTTLNVTVTPACVPTPWYPDVDVDGYGAASAAAVMACSAPVGHIAEHTDCNDVSADVHPGATEICNGVDDNCAGGVDEGLGQTPTCGTGACARTVAACVNGAAGVCTPLQPGTETCNGMDDDCDGVVDDGLPVATCGVGACAHSVPSCVNGAAAVCTPLPPIAETCNGMDDDCDGTVDDGLPLNTFYRDGDGDGYGAAAQPKTTCAATGGDGYVNNSSDCNDANPNIHPGAVEICANAVDDNCNGMVDVDAPTSSTFYRDVDGDTFGSAASGTVTACAPPAGYTSNNGDCLDNDAAVHPGASEVCNAKDDNCAGGIDEGFQTLACGMGACARTVPQCDNGTLRTCSAGVPATEICNGADDDCNGTVDDGTVCRDGGPPPAVEAGRDGAPDVAVEAAGDGGTLPSVIDATAARADAADAARIVDSASGPGAEPHDEAYPGVPSGDNPDAAVTAFDSSTSPPDAAPMLDAMARADARSADAARNDAARGDAARTDGAPESVLDDTSTGCSCRLATRTTRGGWPLLGLGVLVGLAARRRSVRSRRR